MTQDQIKELLADHTYVHMCTSLASPGTYFSYARPCDAYSALKQLAMTLDMLQGHCEWSVDAETDEMLAVYPLSLVKAMTV